MQAVAQWRGALMLITTACDAPDCRVPPNVNANFAAQRHTARGRALRRAATVVLASRSRPSNQSGDGEIRMMWVHIQWVACVLAARGQPLFWSESPAFPWLLA